MICPRVVIFDLDDTLAESFQPPTAQMVEKLHALLDRVPIGLMTAAGLPRIREQFIDHLKDSEHISRFYIFPNSTAECYVFKDGEWGVAYSLGLTQEDRELIKRAITDALAETGILGESPKHEPLIIDRDAQIAFAALGLGASYEDKASWDPDRKKRLALIDVLLKKIPQFEILMGGMTTIDITHKGINKAYGVKWLSENLGIPTGEMIFVGDALYPGGNDHVVIPTGIQTRAVTNPSETLLVIDELLTICPST